MKRLYCRLFGHGERDWWRNRCRRCHTPFPVPPTDEAALRAALYRLYVQCLLRPEDFK